MSPILAIAMEQRGKDSWGVTDGINIFKKVGQISETFIDYGLEGPLYHTRAASIGAISERNAHPFQFEHEGKVVVGAHNGHLHNHYAIKDKYDRKDVQVDSEHIFMHLAEGKPLSDFGGYGAVIWYEYFKDEPQNITRYFSRFNHDALHFGQLLSGEIAFASSEKCIRTAAILAGTEVEYFYDTEAKVQYCIESHGGQDSLLSIGTLDWGERPLQSVTQVVPATTNRTYDYRNNSSARRCAINGCYTIVNKDELICEHDLQRITKDVMYAGSDA